MANFCSNYVLSATRYIEDGDEIKKYFAAFHLLDNFPAAVIVDDFADFFSERCNFSICFLIGSNLEMPLLCSSKQT